MSGLPTRVLSVYLLGALSWIASAWHPVLACLPATLVIFSLVRRARRKAGAPFRAATYVRLLLAQAIVTAWSAALVYAALHLVLRLPVTETTWRVVAMGPWAMVPSSVGHPNPALTGVRVAVMRVLYDVPMLAVVALFRAGGERLNSLQTRVADHVLLGALPFAADVPELRREGVRAVVNMCAEWAGPAAAYRAAGIEQLRLPTPDFGMPSEADLRRAAAFIAAHVDKGHTVFVHCKCGMGRSATAVLAYLCTRGGMPVGEAVQMLCRKRVEVVESVVRYPSLRALLRDERKAE